MILTDWIPFDRIPSARSREQRLYPGYTPEKFRLHVFIPPWIEPARVYIDAVVEARGIKDMRKVFYRVLYVSRWLFENLETELSESGVPVPESFQRRQRLAERLLGAEAVARRGGPVPDEILDSEPGLAGVGDLTNPSRIPASYVAPIYPYERRRVRQSGKVFMTAIVTEDGCVRNIKVLGSKGGDEFTVSAREAVALWRYRPSTRDGKHVPAQITIIVDYTM